MRLGCRKDKVERQGKTRQGRARRGPAQGALRVASVLALAPSPRQGRARAALGRRHRLQPIHRRRTQRSKADPHGPRCTAPHERRVNRVQLKDPAPATAPPDRIARNRPSTDRPAFIRPGSRVRRFGKNAERISRPPVERVELKSGPAIPFSMGQGAARGGAAGSGFVRCSAGGHDAPDLGRSGGGLYAKLAKFVGLCRFSQVKHPSPTLRRKGTKNDTYSRI